MAREVDLTPVAIRATNTAIQSLDSSVDVGDFTRLDLLTSFYEGDGSVVRVITSDQKASEEGWHEVAKVEAGPARASVLKTILSPLKYVRWEVIDPGRGGSVAFKISGVAKHTEEV